ncbi:MAG: class I SAM-dependent methyltransferase, partial [Anaerolineae bacterium]|nr:class I SAM-dependent methyltransferase [Anaerolineae bacterium]
MPPSQDDVKAQTQARFGEYAQGYVTSQSHASGEDLDRLSELAGLQPEFLVLDVATGGGHTALRMAAGAQKVVAADLTPKMLQAARTFIEGQDISNVEYVATDAEQLAFTEATFDLVTCRIAPHHFPDCFRFVQECARVLKPGGRLLVEDHVLPDDERAARYIDSFERLRDPSHFRAFAAYEWEGMYLDAGLTVEHSERLRKPGVKLIPWAERQGCTPGVIERLQIMLAQAPKAVASTMNPTCAGTT